MDEQGSGCPNCGHALAHYRSESQHAGHRTVWLHWLICGGCRHMVLQNWAYSDEPVDDSMSPDQAPARSSRAQQRGHQTSHLRFAEGE